MKTQPGLTEHFLDLKRVSCESTDGQDSEVRQGRVLCRCLNLYTMCYVLYFNCLAGQTPFMQKGVDYVFCTVCFGESRSSVVCNGFMISIN